MVDSKDTQIDKTTSTETNSKNDEVIVEVVEQKKSHSNAFAYVLIIIVAVVAAAGGFYLFQQQQQLAQQLQNENADMKLLIQQAENKTNIKVDTLNTDVQKNINSITDISTKQTEISDLTQKAIAVTKRGQRGWVLAEVDYLLRLANRRLQIARDINGAIAALSGANERIYDLGDLSLFPIRKQLSKDIAQLKALHQVDVNGTAMAIDEMIVHLSSLPFKSAQDEMKAQLEDKQDQVVAKDGDLVDSIIDTVMKIGDIKVHQRSLQPASSAEQQTQLEQILRTHLLGARLAVLRYDQTQFEHDLKQSQQILHSHYKASDNRVTQMQKDLIDFSNINLTPDLPDITKSWSMLQDAIAGYEPTPPKTKSKEENNKNKKVESKDSAKEVL